MRLRLVASILAALAVGSLLILPAPQTDAEQCLICDNVQGIAICRASDPPDLAYRNCVAGEICIQIGGETVCFQESCFNWDICVLYI